ncbi:Retrovirus-related Pol polyprotein from transposon 17.6, partial [Schistosoma japonicum]
YPEPTTIKQLRAFNELVSFYRRFIPNCASIVKPLTDQLRGNKRVVTMDSESKKAFVATKKAIANVTMLAHYNTEPLVSIAFDASDSAIGAVLQQWTGRAWQPLAFFLRRLNDTESRYSIFGRELLAMYCRGRQFESGLFHALTKLLGTTRFRTTAYHPQFNGLVERFHRQLKASLAATNIPEWIDALPLILLGIR